MGMERLLASHLRRFVLLIEEPELYLSPHAQRHLFRLLRVLAQRGKRLSRGMVVMTGSIVTTKFVHPGDTVRFRVDGLDEVRLSVA